MTKVYIVITPKNSEYVIEADNAAHAANIIGQQLGWPNTLVIETPYLACQEDAIKFKLSLDCDGNKTYKF